MPESDEDGPVCGSTDTTDGSACQNPVDDPDATCHLHGDDGMIPDGHGSGDPDHRFGNGQPPDGNKNAMSHGLHAVQADPHGVLDWVESNDPDGYDWIQRKFESYLDDAPFSIESAKADDVLEACLMKYAVRRARREQVSVGLTKMMQVETEDGATEVDVEQELPANLPANRMAREARSMLKDLGILDDPESAKADAMSDWGAAAKKVAERKDGSHDEETAAN